MEKGPVIGIFLLNRFEALKEKHGNLAVALYHSQVERRIPLLIRHVGIGALLEEETDGRQMTAARGFMNGPRPLPILRINGFPVFEQNARR